MLLAASLFVLVSLSCAQYQTRCGQELGTTIKETGDGVEARYTVEWCLRLPNATNWKLELKYINYNDTESCPEATVKSSLKYKHDLHSLAMEKLNRSECNITCLSKPLDLVFSGCYAITNQVTSPARTFRPITAIHRVRNRFKGVQDFNDLKPVYHIEKDSDIMSIQWDLHYIPVLDYSMEIDEYENNDKTRRDNEWVSIEENCTRATYSVRCAVRAPPPARCLAAALRHQAPWHNGTLFRDANFLHYCSPAQQTVGMSLPLGRWAWWALGALLLAVAALLACWAAHARALAALRKAVLRDWTRRLSTSSECIPPDSGFILLLYARDCAPAMEAIAVLRDMLEASAPGRVLDIFSPSCVELYAPAPAAWLHGVLALPDTRVVLVQTPAAAALYDPRLGADSRLQEPLLGSRVQYRQPHFGDALLQHALRLVRDMAPLQQEYTRYYVATVAELPGEIMPQLAPLRRFPLPALAPALLAALRRAPPPARAPPAPPALAAALQRLRELVQRRPDYLRDELMFLPPNPTAQATLR